MRADWTRLDSTRADWTRPDPTRVIRPRLASIGGSRVLSFSLSLRYRGRLEHGGKNRARRRQMWVIRELLVYTDTHTEVQVAARPCRLGKWKDR